MTDISFIQWMTDISFIQWMNDILFITCQYTGHPLGDYMSVIHWMTNNDRYIGHPPDDHYTDLLILIIHRRTDTSHPLDDRYPLHPVDNQYWSHPVDDRYVMLVIQWMTNNRYVMLVIQWMTGILVWVIQWMTGISVTSTGIGWPT
jgi:hypothetical protein